jgi:DnaJ-class molecular chaperone
MPDPYQTLGVSKSASADEIKSAYRKLAKKLHPDVNPGKKDVEQRFKDVTAAYDLLSDPEKRKRYDRGEIDAQGNERGFSGDPFGGGGGGGGNWRRSYSSSGSGGGDPFAQFGGGASVEDILSEFMGGARSRRGGGGGGEGFPGMGRGQDVAYTLHVPFAEAALGGKQRVTLAGGKPLEVTIPPGTEDGHKLRLRGQGHPGTTGPGDALIEIHVDDHPWFTRKGNDVYLDVPVSLPEALLGATINVPTLDGNVSLKVPKGANSGTTLRLKGKGIPHGKETGDMFAKLRVVLPDTPSPDLNEFIEKWAKKNAYDPRKKLGW